MTRRASPASLRRALLGIVAIVVACPVGLAATAEVRARQAIVASQSELASAIGADVMRDGGNAVDAAVAVGFALAVAFPEAGNLGGGGFLLIRDASGKAVAIDFRETAPAAATATMFLAPDQSPLGGDSGPQHGWRSVAVPGTVAGLELAWKRYGSRRVSWSRLIEPAVRLARRGFVVDRHLAESLAAERELLARDPSCRAVFFRGDRPLVEGERLVQADLAATLRRVARHGAAEFAHGLTAQRIVAAMRQSGGLITAADLLRSRPIEREPLRGSYREHTILAMPPPSSGGGTLLLLLNLLERHELRTLGWNGAESWHIWIESMRRAFAIRSEHYGDPDQQSLAIERFLDKRYAAALAATIDPSRATPSAQLSPDPLPRPPEPNDTTHFAVIDPAGAMVSCTTTLNALFGARVMAPGTGVLLNDEMDDFTTAPGQPNQFGLIQGARNQIAPGRRPLSSMAPTIVLRPDGRPWLALGARGGPRIISTVAHTLVNLIDHEMALQAALDAPRIHHQWLPDLVQWERFGISPETRRALEALGHRFDPRSDPLMRGVAVAIDPETGVRLGAVDRRGPGRAVGY